MYKKWLPLGNGQKHMAFSTRKNNLHLFKRNFYTSMVFIEILKYTRSADFTQTNAKSALKK